VVGALVSSNQIANSNIQPGTIPPGTTVTSIVNGSGGFQNGVYLGPLVPTQITLSNPMTQSFSNEGLTFYTNTEKSKVLTINTLNDIAVGQNISGQGILPGTIVTGIDHTPGLNGLAGAVVLSHALTSDAGGVYNFSQNSFFENIYSSQSGAIRSIGEIDGVINSVNSNRTTVGSYVNRLVHAADNATNMSINLTESRSSILDADYALETTNLAKSQIIQQAATAMLAQANQNPQLVVKLLENL
jgi:flagellin-like hook-associated protein FlgL